MRPHDLGLLVAIGVALTVCTTETRGQIQAMPPYVSYDAVRYPGDYSQGRIADSRSAPTDGYRPGNGLDPGYSAYTPSREPAVPSGIPSPPGMLPPPAQHDGPSLPQPYGPPPQQPYGPPAQQPYGPPPPPQSYEPSPKPYAPPPNDPNVTPAYASAPETQEASAFGALHESVPWGNSIHASPSTHTSPPAGAMPVQAAFTSPTGGYSVNSYWTWQVAPEGIIYKSYLAGGREPRMGSQWFYERDLGWLWDSTLGGRVGLVRYGTNDAAWPEGWQLDFEGAAFPRLDLENDRDLISVDFRFGFPLTFRDGPWEWKFSYYHLCSHMGDEYLERYPDATRLNFVRDALVLGLAFRPHPDLRLYVEAGYAPWYDGGSEPWEFQYGIDYSPIEPTGFRGAPFLAVNGRIREEVDFGGSFTAQAGWQWRGETGKLFRFGAHYFNGMSDQYQFFRTFEEHIGLGLWYDF